MAEEWKNRNQKFPEFGQGGLKHIDDTAEVSGRFFFIDALADTTFAVLEGQELENVTNMMLPAGFSLRGVFTKIKLTSGRIIAYKA